MKSLLMTPELFGSEGGIARMLRLYLKALCELAGEGDSVRLLSLNDAVVDSGELRRYSDGKLVEWEVCARSRPRFIRSAHRMGRRSNRIVCGHMGQLPVAWAVSMLKPAVTYYLVAHGIEVWRPFSILERWALRRARRILCVSEYTERRMLEECPRLAGRTCILPNALDPYLVPKSVEPGDGAPPTVLCISRLSLADDYKGIEHLVAAMPAIRSQIPAARLRVVGRGDGLPRLQAMARALSLSEAVEFTGYRSDAELKLDFERSRIFALPSKSEGFGLVYVEAMAHGRPCLAARSGGAPEVITPDTGLLVEYGDVPGIASALVTGLRREWNPSALLGRAEHFSYLRFKERLASLLSR